MTTPPPAPSIDSLLHAAKAKLAEASFAPSRREAALLLGHVLGWSEARLLARGEEAVSAEAASRFHHLLTRRLAGEPVAYLLRQREFFGRDFQVDGRVLIPRPETEHLVEAALGVLALLHDPQPVEDSPALDNSPRPAEAHDRPRVLDVGTGSGCLAVTLALEAPQARVAACDLSPAALAVAAGNARRLSAAVAFFAADLTSATHLHHFDLVVSNPPYIDPAVASDLSPEVVEHEPALALFADEAGRRALRRLIEAAGRDLRPGGHLLLEVGHDQADAAADFAAASGLQLEGVIHDYAGIPRVVHLRRSD